MEKTPELTAAPYTALTGQSDPEVLTPLNESGAGLLSRCSDDFVATMAMSNAYSLQLADQDAARGDDELTSFAAHQAQLSRAWMQAAPYVPAVSQPPAGPLCA